MILNPALQAYRSMRVIYRRIRRRSVFEKIYRENLWGDAESRSGSGSSLAATEKIRKGLLDTIQQLNVRSMVDAPCGDYYWLSTLNLSQYLVSYVGLDIVPELIVQNRQSWGSDKICFEHGDLIKGVPPRADLILCRHLLIHLGLEDCLRVLRNFKRSGSRYLMVTNQPLIERNDEIIFMGSYRPVNIYLPPFNFPKPILSVDDSQAADAEAAVFDLASIELP